MRCNSWNWRPFFHLVSQQWEKCSTTPALYHSDNVPFNSWWLAFCNRSYGSHAHPYCWNLYFIHIRSSDHLEPWKPLNPSPQSISQFSCTLESKSIIISTPRLWITIEKPDCILKYLLLVCPDWNLEFQYRFNSFQRIKHLLNTVNLNFTLFNPLRITNKILFFLIHLACTQNLLTRCT